MVYKFHNVNICEKRKPVQQNNKVSFLSIEICLNAKCKLRKQKIGAVDLTTMSTKVNSIWSRIDVVFIARHSYIWLFIPF